MVFPKFSPARLLANKRGMTLIEMTLVISVLLGLISVTFYGVTAYGSGVDRAMCVQNLSSMQKSVISLANLEDYRQGEPVPDLESELIGDKAFFKIHPTCPAKGHYEYLSIIPTPGQQFMTCDVIGHELPAKARWLLFSAKELEVVRASRLYLSIQGKS